MLKNYALIPGTEPKTVKVINMNAGFQLRRTPWAVTDRVTVRSRRRLFEESQCADQGFEQAYHLKLMELRRTRLTRFSPGFRAVGLNVA
jgi:hypothetical protein